MSDATKLDCRAAAELIADQYGRNSDFLIPMLQDLQLRLGYLPSEALAALSEIVGVPESQCYAVATFYSSFSLLPRGRHIITLCLGTVCYLKGGRDIGEVIERELGVKPGGTTEDGLFTYEPVNCLGACALAPVMVVDAQYYDRVRVRQVAGILAKYRGEGGGKGT
jgi:NADH:ubiquinone oxidoreductase subunit E